MGNVEARTLRVAIGEDDVLLREGIARILTDAGVEVVTQSGDADDLLHRTLAYRPDVVITDVQMPPHGEDDGLRAAMELRRREPSIGVLILSQFCEPAYVMQLVGERPEGTDICSKSGSGTSRRSWTPSCGSPQAAARSIPRSSPACSAAARRAIPCAC
jgi:DNA-binding NarL/FixJ family response regulator